ncbi:Uncharacterised protein [Mycobacteroides abscessus subsp. massiliense]|nr:Uncharacterised protein [Mycobacteroides abscessus subsp. massiliense]
MLSTPTACRSTTLRSAASIPFDDALNTPLRSRSSSLTFCPPSAGTSSSRNKADADSEVSCSPSWRHNRASAALRPSPISRSNVVIPGSSA